MNNTNTEKNLKPPKRLSWLGGGVGCAGSILLLMIAFVMGPPAISFLFIGQVLLFQQFVSFISPYMAMPSHTKFTCSYTYFYILSFGESSVPF
jgi:hypothetical protein